MSAADVPLSWFARARPNEGDRSWRMIDVVVAGLLIGHVGSPYAQQPAPLPPFRDASDYLKLDTGDHSISPHFGYVVEGGFFSGRRIVLYYAPDAQEGRGKVPLGVVNVGFNLIVEDSRKAVFAVSDDGKTLLYQHSIDPSTPDGLRAKPEGLYEYVHGRGDRLIHADTVIHAGARGGINRLPKDAISFSMRRKDPSAGPSEGLVRTTGGDEYPARLVGGNALHRAVHFGEADKIKELMQSGLDVEARNSRGFTPLHEAIWYGKQEIVKLLLEGGANVNAPINTHGLDWAPLHEAARFGFNGIIDMLLEKGADINSRNTKGKTSLDIAEEYRQAGTVKHLVSRGARASSEVRLVASGGESEGRKYVSPLGNFSAEFPKMGPGVRIQDPHDKDSGWVSIHDDIGNLRSIMYLRLSAEAMKALASAETRRPALEAFLTAYIMPEQIKRASPKATVQHTEHVNFGIDGALVAVVDMPEGSTMFDVRANRRFDTKRGLLIFNKGDFMYMLSSGENPAAPHLVTRMTPLDVLIEIEKYKLQAFLSRIEFK